MARDFVINRISLKRSLITNNSSDSKFKLR
jgi:hypothetical protein